MIRVEEKYREDKLEQARPAGVLANFNSPDRLLAAVRELRTRGYDRLDAYSPFPVHGMDEALGVRPTRLPWIVLVSGIVGGVSAIGLQWWTNAIDYPFLVSGKPLFSLPANIPVTFEVVILSAALAAFFGMLSLSGLPKLSNPLFRSQQFLRATNDGFFLFVDGQDTRFEADAAANLLRACAASKVETLLKFEEADRLPRGIIMAATVLVALALIPPVMIASVRGSTSDKPRLHNFFDMDFQPKFKSQTATTLFADGRAMRPRVSGTVARGQLKDDQRFHYGTEPLGDSTQVGESGSATADRPPPPEDEMGPTWSSEFPVPVTEELMSRGRERYNIHCSVCHGRTGAGNGLASLRALELEQGTWVPPTSIHADHVRQQPVGQLFNTITNGVRKMPAYGHQIPPADRWAIVLYLRALQRSQNGSIEDVPADIQPTLREIN